jgi:hypothetical protein
MRPTLSPTRGPTNPTGQPTSKPSTPTGQPTSRPSGPTSNSPTLHVCVCLCVHASALCSTLYSLETVTMTVTVTAMVIFMVTVICVELTWLASASPSLQSVNCALHCASALHHDIHLILSPLPFLLLYSFLYVTQSNLAPCLHANQPVSRQVSRPDSQPVSPPKCLLLSTGCKLILEYSR